VTATVAAVQAAYTDAPGGDADRVETLTGEAATSGADSWRPPGGVRSGTPIWIDTVPIWEGDEAWFKALVDQAVIVPSPATDCLCAVAREAGVYLVVGIDEREPHGGTIYNTLLYIGPDGTLLGKHRKLMPTGSERTVWGMGDGSMLEAHSTRSPRRRTICQNYMPRAVLHVLRRNIFRADAGGRRRLIAPCATLPTGAATLESTRACTPTDSRRLPRPSACGRQRGRVVEPGTRSSSRRTGRSQALRGTRKDPHAELT
jgi:hypothetical protein